MTQTNNEREALLDKLLAEYWDIAYSEGNSGLWHGKKAQSTLNDIRKLFKTQSPISQNEHQEAVAFMDEDGEIYAIPEQKLLNISIDDLIKSIGKNGVRLYTSPPKQAIPEESAWLIEKYINGKLHYAYCDEIGILDWTNDSLAAMRFSRKKDAAQLTSIMEDADRVAEHMWVAPTNTEVGE